MKCLCVFQAGTLMAVGLGVAAAGFAGEHNRFDPSVLYSMHSFADFFVIKPRVCTVTWRSYMHSYNMCGIA